MIWTYIYLKKKKLQKIIILEKLILNFVTEGVIIETIKIKLHRSLLKN